MVTVTPVNKKAEDERGSTHFFNTDRTGEFIIAYRKKGSVNAQHYHKGTAVTKNPEQLILMQGSITLNWFDVRNKDINGSLKIVAPSMVEIKPWAWHEAIADTDFVMFELNGLEDAKEDTFRI